MKKKIFVVFALLLVSLLVFASCDLGTVNFQKFNDLLKIEYSEVKVVINTKTATEELNGTFTLKFAADETTIEYNFEKISTFEIGQDGSITAPDGDFITKKQGTIVLRDGEIVEGDVDVELPDELDVYAGGFSFKQAFFANAVTQNAKFEADVVNPQGFTGSNTLVCSDMHVVVFQNLNAGTLSNIELTYTANGADVTINYFFTK